MLPIIKTILVYLDGSSQSYCALRMGILLAREMGAGLHTLSVVNTRALSDLVKAQIFLESERDDFLGDLVADVDRYMNRAREMGKKKGVVVNTISAKGAISVEIREAVKITGADLLILGDVTEIRSRRDELRDETERAAKTVPCSVLIAKDEDRIHELYEMIG